jgi:hypothetical protein
MKVAVERPAIALTQEEWVLANPKRLHAAGFALVDSYPSQCMPPHLPPEPMLLDTCTIQHLEWARRSLPKGSLSPAEALGHLRLRFGVALTEELAALVDLERMAEDDLPFCVSFSSREELARAPAWRRGALLAEWDAWEAHARAFDPDAHWPVKTLLGEHTPAHVATVHPDQLPLFEPANEMKSSRRLRDRAKPTTLGPFTDRGDCALISDADRSGVPVILTTDLRTFWRHREWLYRRGIEVWRPTDVRQAYINYSQMPSSPVYPPID